MDKENTDITAEGVVFMEKGYGLWPPEFVVPNFVDASPDTELNVDKDGRVYSTKVDNMGTVYCSESVIHSPKHYNDGDIECIDAIRASMSKEEFEGYLKGNTLKYIWRYKYKGHAEQDLDKASVYMGWLKEFYATGKITKTKS